MIGDDIEITVVDVKGDTVRLGINAPRSIPVHRKEIYLAIQQENIEAAKSDREGIERLGKLLGGAGLGEFGGRAGSVNPKSKTPPAADTGPSPDEKRPNRSD